MVKNVLHLIDTNFLSGPGKTIFNSWRFSDKSRYNIIIAVFSDGDNAYVRFLKDHNAPVIEIKERVFGLPYQLSYFNNIYAISKLLAKFKIDILHTHHHKADFFGLLASILFRVKVISTHHGFIENTNRAARANKIARWSTKRMSAVIAVSEKMKQELTDFGMPSEKLHMIHNAIVVEDYPQINKSVELLNELRIQNKWPVIGYIGRISKEKGQELLCEAFVRLGDHFPDAVLVIVGSGPELEDLRIKYTNSQPSIVFTGFKTNIKEFISIFDLHVLPSYTEGLPNVVLETALMGVPNIVTRVGGSPECVVENETGLVVQPGKVDEITAAIIHIMNNKNQYQVFKHKGISFIKKEYNFQHRMQKIMDLYDKVLF